MASLYGWIRNLICFICILNLVLQILPGSSFKKYVRFFGGVLLVVLVMKPLGELIQISGGFEQVWRTEKLKEEFDGLEASRQGMEELRLEKINEAYQAEIKRQIEEIVRAYGLLPKRTDISFGDGEAGVSTIRFIKMELSANSETGTITVPKIEKKTVSSAEIENIKKEIQEVYHISGDSINIIVQE